jgi:diaminopimelate decarboxylase
MSKIFVSGLYSGPSPSAGLGIAKSIRTAFPDVHIVGVDYWLGSSGLHDEVFDEIRVFPSWDLIDHVEHRRTIQGILDQGDIYFPSLDLECHWLAKNLAPLPRLIAPDLNGLEYIKKPAHAVAEMLGVGSSKILNAFSDDEEVHQFLRHNNWRVWLKSPFHEATMIRNWREFVAVRALMERKWKTRDLFLEVHTTGHERSICFAAVQGKISDAVLMIKRQTTPDGKTWSGEIQDVPEEFELPLQNLVQSLNWNGGAEIELIMDQDQRPWMLEWNPRFPAWIYGAALCGRNLPGSLISRVLGLKIPESKRYATTSFTRVVQEIPTRTHLGLPQLDMHAPELIGAGNKYGAGWSEIVPKLSDEISHSKPYVAVDFDDHELLKDITDQVGFTSSTPRRVHLNSVVERNFSAIFNRFVGTQRSSRDEDKFILAYSVKTSPDSEFMQAARSKGFLAECISLLEVDRAMREGFSADQVILNGPGKWWPQQMQAPRGLRAIFCDSTDELERLLAMDLAPKLIGPRLKLPQTGSRFGIGVDQPQEFRRLIQLLKKIPSGTQLGVHHHMASSAIGYSRWIDAFVALLHWASAIQQATGREIELLDLGGGWYPGDLESKFPVNEIRELVADHLGANTKMVIEPGKALTQKANALVTRVLDIRRSEGRVVEVVSDACIAELALASVHPHQLLHRGPTGRTTILPFGVGRILGRICMEDDVLAQNISFPENLELGDQIIFCDSGAYDRSMSYEFGRG